MKNIFITLLIMLFAFGSKAINLGLTGCSFDTSATIEPGSAQWVDVKLMSGGYLGTDRVKIYIQYKDANGYYNGTLVKVHDTLFYPYVFNLPANPDNSRRVHFTMPDTALGRNFIINVNLAPSIYYGIFNYTPAIEVPTSIRNNKTPQNIPVKEIRYYNLLGAEIPEPSGKYIRKTVYEDDSFSSQLMMVIY